MSLTIYFRNYAAINGFLWIGGTLSYIFYTTVPKLWILFVMTYMKNTLIAEFLKSTKPEIPHTRHGSRSIAEDAFYLAKISIFDTASLWLLTNCFAAANSVSQEIILFIPKSFLYEIIFDFFHYWAHRTTHAIPVIYRAFHAEHHAQILLDPYKAYYQSYPDLIITNFLPLVAATKLIPVSPFFLFVFFWYKTFTEASGHIGKSLKATCFPQCMWLPRFLGIALHADDHELHHTHPRRNFGKRFALWDRVFGTWMPAEIRCSVNRI